MRLTRFRSDISPELLTAFEHLGIKTVARLLFLPSYDLFRRLPPNLTTLQELEACLSSIAEHSSAAHLRGRDLILNDTCSNSPALSDGAHVLDDLLNGFGHSRVIEITGDEGTGKTVLAMNAIKHFLTSDRRRRALWVDTTGDFSLERMVMLCETCTTSDLALMERLEVAVAFDIEEAYNVLETWFSPFNSKRDYQFLQHCVVIDTVTSLLGPILSPVSSQGHAIMVDFMYRLRELSGISSARVLAINRTAMERNVRGAVILAKRKPALGPSFTYLTDVTLWLSQVKDSVKTEVNQGSVCIANIYRSRTTVTGFSYRFTIEHGVVRPCEG
ncbi:P-loop containing nucleoside triphosphate hydrolase protein [Cyathus striatus]|nr:P-loop containing nucleoside triphosphate hydrolase protein [Cyathus striatus]